MKSKEEMILAVMYATEAIIALSVESVATISENNRWETTFFKSTPFSFYTMLKKTRDCKTNNK